MLNVPTLYLICKNTERLHKQKQAREEAEKEIQRLKEIAEKKFNQFKNEVCHLHQ